MKADRRGFLLTALSASAAFLARRPSRWRLRPAARVAYTSPDGPYPLWFEEGFVLVPPEKGFNLLSPFASRPAPDPGPEPPYYRLFVTDGTRDEA